MEYDVIIVNNGLDMVFYKVGSRYQANYSRTDGCSVVVEGKQEHSTTDPKCVSTFDSYYLF